MLNELYQLSEVLEKTGIATQDWHKDFRVLPKIGKQTPCFKITLTCDAGNNEPLITTVEILRQEQIIGLRKYMPSNGLSFPCFNIGPVVAEGKAVFEQAFCKNAGVTVEADLKSDKLEALFIDTLKKTPLDSVYVFNFRQIAHPKFRDKKNETLRQCLNEIPPKLCEKLGDIPEKFTLLQALIHRVSSVDAESFMQALANQVCQQLAEDPSVWPKISPLLVLSKPLESGDESLPGISVVLEGATQQPLPDGYYPVAHDKTHAWINQRLLDVDTMPITPNAATETDAFREPATGSEEKLDSVTLPQLGIVILRAMTKESPCQYRYRTADAESFRIGRDSRRKAKAALEWLSGKERAGKTWGVIDSKELLFAYPSQSPERPAPYTRMFGAAGIAVGESEAVKEASFQHLAKETIDCLQGISHDLDKVTMQVFALRKMDKARTKVVFHRNVTALRLKERADVWQRGCNNLPPMRFRDWGKNKGELLWLVPKTPAPLDVADCINHIWKRKGTSVSELKWKRDGTTVSELNTLDRTIGIDLLFGNVGTEMLAFLLRQALNNTQGLLLALGQAKHSGQVLSLKKLTSYKQHVPAVFGLLLDQLNLRKEHYMTSPPFLIGNILAISDQLHALYCKHMRKGDMPPQLLGNAVMSSALETPTQALALLAQRLVPYLGWAATNKTEDIGLSRFFLKQYRDISGVLKEKALPQRLNDSERATLLLGYLAGVSKETSESAQSNPQDLTTNITEGKTS
jgi:hypothetical protein